MILDNDDLKLLEKVQELTLTNYEIKKYPERNEGYISEDSVIALIQDLLMEIDSRDEEIEHLKNDIESNYKPISLAEQYEIRDSDFI